MRVEPEPSERAPEPDFVIVAAVQVVARVESADRAALEFKRYRGGIFDVSYVWLVDPATRTAFRWTKEGMREVRELRTENPEIVVPVNSLFED